MASFFARSPRRSYRAVVDTSECPASDETVLKATPRSRRFETKVLRRSCGEIRAMPAHSVTSIGFDTDKNEGALTLPRSSSRLAPGPSPAALQDLPPRSQSERSFGGHDALVLPDLRGKFHGSLRRNSAGLPSGSQSLINNNNLTTASQAPFFGSLF